MDNKYLEGDGNIRISEEVICTIVRTAAKEVEGISSIVNRPGTDIKGLIPSKRNAGKGVGIELHGGQLEIELGVYVNMGIKIHETVGKLQGAVKKAVESMTGMKVSSVNVYVQGMDAPKTTADPITLIEGEEEEQESEQVQET